MTFGAPSSPCVVVFNYAEWTAQYPEFAYLTPPQAQGFFNRGTLYCDNTPCSPITDLFQRAVLLNMVTAHMAFLFAPQPGTTQPRELVGRISQASEGTVSVATVYAEPTSDLQAWFNQSPYGAAFWAATTRYRTGRYYPPARVPFTRLGGRAGWR